MSTDYYHKNVTELFGKRRGSLYRSEKDYYNIGDSRFGGPGPSYDMHATALVAKRNRQGAHDEKGKSKGGDFQYIGSIPLGVVLCHPELTDDPDAILEFFKDHNKFSMKG